MPEDIQQGQEELEKTQGEEQQPEDLSASQEPEQDSQEELPEDVKSRTQEQFEKLKKHNAELKKQLDDMSSNKQQLPSVLEAYLSSDQQQVTDDQRMRYQQPQPQYYQQPQMQQQQAPAPEPQLIEDGYINPEVLQRQLESAKNAEQRALEAQRKAEEAQRKISEYEITQETKELYREFPELDPNSQSFNKDAYDLVSNELTSQIVKSGKRNAMEAASKMSKYFRKPVEEIKSEENLQKRSQVVSSNQANTTTRPPSMSDEELRRKSRYDSDALYERLKQSGY